MGRTGYNIENINNLTKAIQDGYTKVETAIKTNWGNLTAELDRKWVGEDEQSYCLTLAKKVNSLTSAAAFLSNKACKAIEDGGSFWLTFQKEENYLADAEKVTFSSSDSSGTIEHREIEAEENLVSYNTFNINSGTDRGLVDAEAGAACLSALKTFVTNIKDSIGDLFSNIDAAASFFGTQSTQVGNLITTLSSDLGEVVTAVNDMKKAIQQLTTTNYNASDDDAVYELDTLAGDMEANTNLTLQTAGTKWIDDETK